MSIEVSEHAGLIAAAEAMADAAAAVTLPLFRSEVLATQNKLGDGGFDPVTQADREAEQAIRAVVAERYPHDAVLGEEFEPRSGTSGRRWVLDPIDGTRAFISGMPSWGTLIGLDEGDGPVLGLIDQPYIGERFIGAFGEASLQFRGERRNISVRECDGLGDAILYSTFPEIGSAAERDGFGRVSSQVRLTRYGTDCYGYALLAMGQCDLVIEAGLNPYDVAGPIGVVQAAGGIVTNWRGGPAHEGGRILAAGDARLHEIVVGMLSEVAEG